MQMLLHLNENFDDDFLFDSIGLLSEEEWYANHIEYLDLLWLLNLLIPILKLFPILLAKQNKYETDILESDKKIEIK